MDLSYYYIIKYNDGIRFITEGDFVFVADEKLNKNVSIFGLAISDSKGRIYFGEVKNITFSMFPKNFIKMDFKTIKK